MKNITKLFALAVVILGFSVTSFGQATGVGTAIGTISAGTAISIGTGTLDFGSILKSGAGTIKIDEITGAASSTGAVATSGATRAEFRVDGQADWHYTITGLDNCTVAKSDNSLETMSVTGLASDIGPDAKAGLLTLGTQTIKVGGTLNILATTPAGSYSTANSGGSPFSVTVTYE